MSRTISNEPSAFKVLFSNQGSQGILGQPSNQQLETVFGSKKDVDCVEQILKLGTLKSGDGITGTGTFNETKGSAVIDNKGGMRTTGI
jgi:hypothetical protein